MIDLVHFNWRKWTFSLVALTFTLMLSLDFTRVPFLMLVIGLMVIGITWYRLEWGILLIFATLLVPWEIPVAGIILKPADFLIGWLFICLLMAHALEPSKKLLLFPYPKTIACFILMAGLSLVRAKDAGAGLSDILQLIELYVMAGLIFTNFLTPRLMKELGCLLIGGVLVQLFWVGPALSQGARFWGWMSGSMAGNYAFIAVFTSILLFHFVLHAKGKKKYYFIIAFLLTWFGLILSGTRSAWLAAIIGILTATYFVSRRFFRKSLIIVLVLFVLLIMFAPMNISERIQSIIDPQYFSNVSRAYLILSAWNAFIEHPILGVGIKNLHTQIPEFLPLSTQDLPEDRKITMMHEIKNDAGAHNMYFEVLAELGLTGMICVLILLGSALREAHYNLKLSETPQTRFYNSCTFSSFSAFLVMALFVPGIHVRVDYTIFLVLLLSSITLENRRLTIR